MNLEPKKLKKMIKKYLEGSLDLCQEEFQTLCAAYEKVISLPPVFVHLQPPPVVSIERIQTAQKKVPKSTDKSSVNFTLVIKELNIYLHPSDVNLKPSEILKN